MDETDRRALEAHARGWIADDPDPGTRAELTALLEAGDHAALRERFAGQLEFGTAGLRGRLGAGPTRMNRVVASRAAAGLAAYVRAHGGGRVVIGFDARHGSRAFATDTAEIVRGAGLDAACFDRPVPTPLLAFAVRRLGAAAAVMVTASHNPPQDNGYKVYVGDGAQIAPPVDAEIAAEIARVDRVGMLPRAQGWEVPGDALLDAYLERALDMLTSGGPRDVRIAYTPLHGVGGGVFTRALRLAGFPDPVLAASQYQPDPDFPTVRLANPEEPGTLEVGMTVARSSGADLLIAHDPDADRCAVAVPDPAAVGWRMLRGDELGALLAVHLLRRDASREGVIACSIVSSSLLARIAAAHGVEHRETLTGFKWIARVPGLRYGYEEALGYCADPEAVRDKDGIMAALLVAELAATLKRDGRTVLDVLDDLAREHGLHATDQLSLRVDDPAEIRAAMGRLRAAPPAALGGLKVTAVDDLERGDGGLPPTAGVRLRLRDGDRVIVRPSGTEPKLKSYIEVVEPVAGGDVSAVRTRAAAAIGAVRDDLRAALALG